MSNNAEFDAEFPFASDSDPFSSRPKVDANTQSTEFRSHANHDAKTASKSKPNLVVRAWRAVADFVSGIGKAVFSKQFWIEFIGTAIRDALAALSYSIGMRMVKKATATGDLIFQDKHGAVRTADSPPVSGSAVNRQTDNRGRGFGFADDFMASPVGNQSFRQGPFRN